MLLQMGRNRRRSGPAETRLTSGESGARVILLRLITNKRELKTAKHCAIYKEELSRVWPDDGNQREPKIARFAEDNGFRLRFYRDGLCAIFDKEPEREKKEPFRRGHPLG